VAGYNDPESGYVPGATGMFTHLGHVTHITNKFDKDATPSNGDMLQWDSALAVYKPTPFLQITERLNLFDPSVGSVPVGDGSETNAAADTAARSGWRRRPVRPGSA
jgi:hypothetical protein